MIAYQPDVDIQEVRKVDGWHIHLPVAAEVMPERCGDEVNSWLTVADWTVQLPAVQKERVPTLQERFREQAQKWEQETRFVSSITKRINHPSYTAILGMAQEPGIIGILLRDLQENRRPWFWALSYMTQTNPVSQEDAGKTDKMIAAWLKWGKEKRYIR